MIQSNLLPRVFIIAVILFSFVQPASAEVSSLKALSLRPATPYPLPEHAWRIPIAEDGLYSLSYETLLRGGFPVSTTAPGAIHLSWMGQPVAMLAQGESDGTFDPDDAFIFYGQKFHGSEQDEKYTDENVYWLTIDAATPGSRMASRDVVPVPDVPQTDSYSATLHIEENNHYWARWSAYPGTDATWFWDRAIAATKPVTRTFPLQLSGVFPSTTDATLRVEVAARNANVNNPDHHLRWLINGEEVGEDSWEGKIGRVYTTSFPSSILHNGENQLQMVLEADVGVQDIFFDRAILDYPRTFVAEADQLTFSGSYDGPASYTLTDFSNSPTFLFDIEDPLRPILLTGAQPAEMPGTLSFTDSATAEVSYAAYVSPLHATVSSYNPPDDLLDSPLGADQIIITPSLFYAATQPLAQQRRSEGLRVQIVRVEDIYNLFNGGVFHPRAIRDFLAYTYANWPGSPPAYVLLVGDGHFNFKGHNPDIYGELQPNWIPPYLDFIDPDQGEIAVDSRYAAIIGNDNFPDMAVGRLPVNSVDELTGVIDKLIRYGTEPTDSWSRRAVYVSDNIPDLAGDFDAIIDTLEAITPAGIDRRRISLTDTCGPPNSQPRSCATASTESLISAWNQGAALLTYAGHGAIHRWAHEPLLTNNQLPEFEPSTGWPFVLSLDCLDGYFMMPPSYPGYTNTRSLAEVAVTLPDRGAIAYFAPSGLGTSFDEQQMALAFYGALFQQGEVRLGPLTQAARHASSTHLAQSYTLFGDPAMPLKIHPFSLSLPLIQH